MCKKAKHCWALSTNFSVQLIVFLDQVLLLAELARKNSKYFKIADGEVIKEVCNRGVSCSLLKLDGS